MDSSNFWKLDKIDKIGISLIFIIFAIYSTFSCFASEDLDVNYLNGYTISGSVITENSNYSVAYIEIEPGYIYTIENSSTGQKRYGFSNEEISPGLVLNDVGAISGSESYSFYGSVGYLYVGYVTSAVSTIHITREEIPGMEGSVDLLAGNVGFNVWESFSNTIVYALPITITCFGIYVICGFVQKFSKGA